MGERYNPLAEDHVAEAGTFEKRTLWKLTEKGWARGPRKSATRGQLMPPLPGQRSAHPLPEPLPPL